MAWSGSGFEKKVGDNPVTGLVDAISGVWGELIKGGMDAAKGIADIINGKTGWAMSPEEVRLASAEAQNPEDMVSRLMANKQQMDGTEPIIGASAKSRGPLVGKMSNSKPIMQERSRK